jgi:hypothetical protein
VLSRTFSSSPRNALQLGARSSLDSHGHTRETEVATVSLVPMTFMQRHNEGCHNIAMHRQATVYHCSTVQVAIACIAGRSYLLQQTPITLIIYDVSGRSWPCLHLAARFWRNMAMTRSLTVIDGPQWRHTYLNGCRRSLHSTPRLKATLSLTYNQTQHDLQCK